MQNKKKAARSTKARRKSPRRDRRAVPTLSSWPAILEKLKRQPRLYQRWKKRCDAFFARREGLRDDPLVVAFINVLALDEVIGSEVKPTPRKKGGDQR